MYSIRGHTILPVLNHEGHRVHRRFWSRKIDPPPSAFWFPSVRPFETYLTEIVKVVLAIDPAERRTLVDAIRLVMNVTNISALAVVQHAFKELQNKIIKNSLFTQIKEADSPHVFAKVEILAKTFHIIFIFYVDKKLHEFV